MPCFVDPERQIREMTGKPLAEYQMGLRDIACYMGRLIAKHDLLKDCHPTVLEWIDEHSVIDAKEGNKWDWPRQQQGPLLRLCDSCKSEHPYGALYSYVPNIETGMTDAQVQALKQYTLCMNCLTQVNEGLRKL